MSREGPFARAPHALVDVAIEVLIQARRPAARGRAADERGRKQSERRHAALGEEHTAERSQEKERHDRGLRERDEISHERALT